MSPRPLLSLVATSLGLFACIDPSLGSTCVSEADCVDGLICDIHDGLGTCQELHEHTGADGTEDGIPLAEMSVWTRVLDPSHDAFADQRPASAACDDLGYFVDPWSQTLEIETEICDYLTLQQPTSIALDAGSQVTVRGYHDVLTAPEPALGYVALAFAGTIEWELTVPIPSDAATFERTFTIDRRIAAGTDLQFHLHNHGPNTWELASVVVTPAN